MQRSDRWTGDGKLTMIKCLARWSEQWVQLIHSRWRQLRFGLGAFGGWIGGLGTGSEVWVARSDISVAGSEVWVLDWMSGWLGRMSRWLDWSSRWLGRTSRWLDRRSGHWIGRLGGWVGRLGGWIGARGGWLRIGGCVLSVFFVTFMFLFSHSLCVAVRGEWPGNELKWKWVRKFISGSKG